jgi:hypothetical protein
MSAASPTTHWFAVMRCLVYERVEELLDLRATNKYLDPGDDEFRSIQRHGLTGLLEMFTHLEEAGATKHDTEGSGRLCYHHPILGPFEWTSSGDEFNLWWSGGLLFTVTSSPLRFRWHSASYHPRVGDAEAAICCPSTEELRLAEIGRLAALAAVGI